jgi:nitrate/nitrite-specific signal transduction histidine kinase
MTHRKGAGARHIEHPPKDTTADPRAQRAAFVHAFFKQGAEFANEIVQENDRLARDVARLQRELKSLRGSLSRDPSGAPPVPPEALEAEIERLSSAYVASFQLHATLEIEQVLRHIRETLMQLAGASAMAVYVADEQRTKLWPVVADGTDRALLEPISLDDASKSDPAIERVFLTGELFVSNAVLPEGSRVGDPSETPTGPVACIPIKLGNDVLGVIVVLALLEQKGAFSEVDMELFNLLSAHAGTALVSALFYRAAGGKAPSLAVLGDLPA